MNTKYRFRLKTRVHFTFYWTFQYQCQCWKVQDYYCYKYFVSQKLTHCMTFLHFTVLNLFTAPQFEIWYKSLNDRKVAGGYCYLFTRSNSNGKTRPTIRISKCKPPPPLCCIVKKSFFCFQISCTIHLVVKQIQSKGKIKLYNQETPLVVLHISLSIHLSNSRFSSPLVPGTTFLVRVLMKYFTLHHSPKHTHSIIFHHSASYNVHLISGPHFYHEWVAAGLCAVLLCTMDLDNDMLLPSTAY